MYRDVDDDGYGDEDYSACLCQGTESFVEYEDETYVIYSGDCYDFNGEIKPLSCSDNIDQDDDGLIDNDDPDCKQGYQEGSSTIKEEPTEQIDGHDNDCDGSVAAIELDCDDDGTFPLLPAESIGVDRNAPFKRAADLGLEACDELTTNLSCWGESLDWSCDSLTAEVVNGEVEYNGTGLWMLSITEDDNGFDERFEGGHRNYPNGIVCASNEGDCDDQCPNRCPGQVESCDGLDNNCSQTLPGTDGTASDSRPGIPDALDDEVTVAGTISDVEIDIDSDGYLACNYFTSSGVETQWSTADCSEINGVTENDCNNFCYFTSPSSIERCDAFQSLPVDGTCNESSKMAVMLIETTCSPVGLGVLVTASW